MRGKRCAGQVVNAVGGALEDLAGPAQALQGGGRDTRRFSLAASQQAPLVFGETGELLCGRGLHGTPKYINFDLFRSMSAQYPCETDQV